MTKCRGIEDVQVFINDSLTSKLKPKSNCKQIKDNTSKLAKNKSKSSRENSAENKSSDQTITEESEENTDSSKENGTKHKTESDIRRAKRLIKLSQSQTRNGSAKEDEGEGETEELASDKTDTAERPDSAKENGATDIKQDTPQVPVVPVTQEAKKPPPIKLSYTSSNITLKGLYNTSLLDNFKPDIQEPRTLGASLTATPMLKNQIQLFTPPEKSKPSTPHNNKTPNQAVVTQLNQRTNSARKKTEENKSCLTVATLKSVNGINTSHTNETGDGLETSRPVSQGGERRTPVQRQVMLVLKKVSLQDNLQDTEEPESPIKWLPYSNSRPNSQSSQRFRQGSISLSLKNGSYPNGKTGVPLLWMNPEDIEKAKDSYETQADDVQDYVPNGTVNTTYFQIGDLLPAVDSSMKRKLPIRAINGERTGSATERDMSVNGKDVLVPYEDNLIMMKEGVELLRLKEKNSNVSS